MKFLFDAAEVFSSKYNQIIESWPLQPFILTRKLFFVTFIVPSILLFSISFVDQQFWHIIHFTITVMTDGFLIHDMTFNHISII